MSDNDLIELPDFICNLTNLKRLNLSNNNLIELPDFICNLTKLESINISINYEIIKCIKSKMIDFDFFRDDEHWDLLEKLDLMNDYECYLDEAYEKYREWLAEKSDHGNDDDEYGYDTFVELNMNPNKAWEVANYFGRGEKETEEAIEEYNNELFNDAIKTHNLNFIKKLPDNILNLVNLKELSFSIEYREYEETELINLFGKLFIKDTNDYQSYFQDKFNINFKPESPYIDIDERPYIFKIKLNKQFNCDSFSWSIQCESE